jgi:hypothetical protein
MTPERPPESADALPRVRRRSRFTKKLLRRTRKLLRRTKKRFRSTRNLFRFRIHKFKVRTGTRQWGTKSFEFWTFLMVLLALVRPKSMVELGSGRSTSYLTEYAMKEGIPFASIEQNRFYVVRNKRGLRNSFLSDGYLRYVPTGEDGWYRVEKLNRVVNFPCELLFVDGPTEFLAPGSRHTERSLNWLAAASATSKVVIVDDVHRKPNLEMFHKLVDASGSLSPMYLSYKPKASNRDSNILAIAVESDSYDTLRKICSEVGIDILDDYAVDQYRTQ